MERPEEMINLPYGLENLKRIESEKWNEMLCY